MKRIQLLLGATLIFGSNLFAQDNIKSEGINYIKMLGGALKNELKAHIKKDPSGLKALTFCTGSAKKITNDVNAKLPAYAKVRRTALRVRNNKTNTPDKVDKEVMEAYKKSIAAKTFTSKDIKVIKVGDTTRVYKPLTIKKVCLKCHGTNLSPKITKVLKGAYPDDNAIGFKEGDLRGVIVAEIKKH